MSAGKRWTRDELFILLNLYVKTPMPQRANDYVPVTQVVA